jgi:hypothetical protein
MWEAGANHCSEVYCRNATATNPLEIVTNNAAKLSEKPRQSLPAPESNRKTCALDYRREKVVGKLTSFITGGIFPTEKPRR